MSEHVAVTGNLTQRHMSCATTILDVENQMKQLIMPFFNAHLLDKLGLMPRHHRAQELSQQQAYIPTWVICFGGKTRMKTRSLIKTLTLGLSDIYGKFATIKYSVEFLGIHWS